MTGEILRELIVSDNEIILGYTPDADDAFMFYALSCDKISTRPYTIRHMRQDIQTLNERAIRQELDITAISIHTYCYIKHHYLLMRCGASMGEGYGPVVVANNPMPVGELRDKTIGIPGSMTTAFLALRLAIGEFNYEEIPFDKILSRVKNESVDAGLIIHEGQITYGEMEVCRIIDLGKWWSEQTGLLLPLGGNAIKKSLGQQRIRDLCRIISESIQYSLDHFADAMDYAMDFAGKLKREEAEKFVRMYVNKWTVDYGCDGKMAIEGLLRAAEQQKLIPPVLPVEFTSILE